MSTTLAPTANEAGGPKTSTSIALLAEQAPNFKADIESLKGNSAVMGLLMPHSDGRKEPYKLLITDKGGGSIQVREVVPTRLPSYCPERHINRDATFCLGWSGEVDLRVTSVDQAIIWWDSLLDFLWKQKRAAHRRRWPEDGAWAHGDAAIHHRNAEQAAIILGPEFAKSLRRGRLTVVKTRYRSTSHGAVLHILRDGRMVYAAWARSYKVINKQRPCVCSRGDIKRHRRLRNCEKRMHGKGVDQLIKALVLWAKEDEAFWVEARGLGRPCCGTIERCPLRTKEQS